MASLNGTLAQTQQAYALLDAYAQNLGIAIGVADYGGVRTQADTTQILQYRDADYQAALSDGSISSGESIDQFRPIAPFGHSYHNYGAAFDVAIVARPSGMSEADAKTLLGVYAPSIGLRWGGNFTNADPSHFELDMSLADAQALYGSAGGTSVAVDSSLVMGLLVIAVIVWSVKRKFT